MDNSKRSEATRGDNIRSTTDDPNAKKVRLRDRDEEIQPHMRTPKSYSAVVTTDQPPIDYDELPWPKSAAHTPQEAYGPWVQAPKRSRKQNTQVPAPAPHTVTERTHMKNQGSRFNLLATEEIPSDQTPRSTVSHSKQPTADHMGSTKGDIQRSTKKLKSPIKRNPLPCVFMSCNKNTSENSSQRTHRYSKSNSATVTPALGR
ncbi:hypothetical protein K2173_027504 [Erythroxylum novogranatense]|uniref:Uncharacterized protein n=1 Tax=Erythroxylum novogranatense TaxID=1862640 RepID=A0AAV8TZ58_9ROSI|nr:hypothetical protein K2173_027504 [Erythroxylum novogranatense]